MTDASLLPEVFRDRRLVLAGLAGLWVAAAAGHGVAAQGGGAGTRVRAAVTSRGIAAIRRAQPRVEYGLSERALRLGAPLYLRIRKREAVLETWLEAEPGGAYRPGRTYRLCGPGTTRLGPRTGSGDTRMPEGFYRITPRLLDVRGTPGLASAVDWPGPVDRARSRRNGSAPVLLTGGCRAAPHIGLTDTDFEELFTLVYAALAFGQPSVPLHIFPHALGPLERLALPDTPEGRFWQDLAPAWRAFGQTQRPPRTAVRGGRYVIPD